MKKHQIFNPLRQLTDGGRFSTKKGFTLLELLLSLAIMVTVGAVGLSTIVVVFRGAKKSQQILLAKQNGNAALSQIVRGARYAKSLDNPNTCVPTTDITPPSFTVTSSFDGGQTTYACQNNTISSNSASLIDTTNFSITSCSFTCSQSDIAKPPIIKMSFTIQTKNQNGLFDTTATIPFETSVTLRNVGQ